jgi:hypothetical protein
MHAHVSTSQLPDAKRHKPEDPKAVSSNVKVDEIHQRAIEKLKVGGTRPFSLAC